jgi:hypothetical protein
MKRQKSKGCEGRGRAGGKAQRPTSTGKWVTCIKNKTQPNNNTDVFTSLLLLLPRMNASFFFFVKHFEFVFFLFLFWWRLLGILLGCSSFLFTNTGYLFLVSFSH